MYLVGGCLSICLSVCLSICDRSYTLLPMSFKEGKL